LSFGCYRTREILSRSSSRFERCSELEAQVRRSKKKVCRDLLVVSLSFE
jgi:hypothetical protein